MSSDVWGRSIADDLLEDQEKYNIKFLNKFKTGLKMSLDPETDDSIVLTRDEVDQCSANIETAVFGSSVCIRGQWFKYEFGGQVPAGLTHEKFMKYLKSQIAWWVQADRIQMKKGGKLGLAMRKAKQLEY